MNKRHYEHTLPNIRGSLSNTYLKINILPLPFYGSPRNPKHLWLPVRRKPFNFANE